MQGREKYMYKNNNLPATFYLQQDVVQIARDLIGKVLVTEINGDITAARIVETEAYNGIVDKASHAYNNRRTRRTEVMFGKGGVAYVYLCYGIHYLFNVVTNTEDTPHAVLIRAAEPLYGQQIMLQRTGKVKAGFDLTRGPGNVSKAMGITVHHTGMSLLSTELFIADDGFNYPDLDIVSSVRIGVDYAAEDALLPYRFFVKNNLYVSGKRAVNNVS